MINLDQTSTFTTALAVVALADQEAPSRPRHRRCTRCHISQPFAEYQSRTRRNRLTKECQSCQTRSDAPGLHTRNAAQRCASVTSSLAETEVSEAASSMEIVPADKATAFPSIFQPSPSTIPGPNPGPPSSFGGTQQHPHLNSVPTQPLHSQPQQPSLRPPQPINSAPQPSFRMDPPRSFPSTQQTSNFQQSAPSSSAPPAAGPLPPTQPAKRSLHFPFRSGCLSARLCSRNHRLSECLCPHRSEPGAVPCRLG